jgi:hypothetical protein
VTVAHSQGNRVNDSRGDEACEELVIRHSKYAGNRFSYEVAPALENFANSSPKGFITGVKAVRETIVARNDEDRQTFLKNQGFSKGDRTKIIETVLREEGHLPESVFDFVQGLTAMARRRENQDGRIDLEQRAKRLFDRVG